jgi:hypothetical protein
VHTTEPEKTTPKKPVSLPAVKPFEQLTEFQYRCLCRVANREDKAFICLSGKLLGTKEDNEKTVIFNEFLNLIELGFFIEMDRDNEQYQKMIRQFEQQGISLMMAEMTNRGQWMWEQTPWEKWVN